MQFTFNVEASLVNNPEFYRLYANFLEQAEALKQPQVTPQPVRQRGPRGAQVPEQPPKRARRNPGPSHSGLEDLRAAFEARAEPVQNEETKKIINMLMMLMPTFVKMAPPAYQKAVQATVDYFQFACDHLEGKIVVKDIKLELSKRAQAMVQEWLATDALDVLCNHFFSGSQLNGLFKQTITALLKKFAAAPEETVASLNTFYSPELVKVATDMFLKTFLSSFQSNRAAGFDPEAFSNLFQTFFKFNQSS